MGDTEKHSVGPARHLGIEFGEAVLRRRKPSGGALGKLSSSWSNGVFLGVKGLSGEVIVSDSSGVYKSRTVHRKPIGDRWDIASADLIRYVPWKVSEEDEKADGECLVAVKLSEEEIAEQIREREFDLGDTAAPRSNSFSRICSAISSSDNFTATRHSPSAFSSSSLTFQGTKRIMSALAMSHLSHMGF